MKVSISICVIFLFRTLLFSSIDAYRILGVFPFQGRSHHVMFDAIIKVLARRGHQIDVMTHFPFKKPIPNYKVVVNLENEQRSLVNAWNIHYVTGMHDDLYKLVPTTFGNDVCEYLKNPDLLQIIKNPPNDPPYDLMITEGLGSPCYLSVAWALKVPVILASSCLDLPWLDNILGQPSNAAYFPHIYSEYFAPLSFSERLINTLTSHRDLFIFRRLTDDYQNTLTKKYIDPDIPPIRELEKNIVLSFVNSYHNMYGIRATVPGLIEVGGLHVREHYKPLPADLEKWMNESTAGVIYFTLGSMANIETFPEDVVKAFYLVFAKLAPVRVLMKVADQTKLLPGLPDNVQVLSWIPQVAVLEHKNIKVFITHGGLLGILEALTFGVPMVGIPLFADQLTNLVCLVRKNIGLQLSHQNLTETVIYEAVNEVLTNPKYRDSAKRESVRFLDRPLSPEDSVVYWTEFAIRHGPQALKSPTVDMPWWQVVLLDVYLFLLVSILLGVYLIFLALRIIKDFLLNKLSKYRKLHKE